MDFHKSPSGLGSFGVSTANPNSITGDKNKWLEMVNASVERTMDALCCNFEKLNVSAAPISFAAKSEKTTFNVSCSAWVPSKANLSSFSLFPSRALQRLNQLVEAYVPACACPTFAFSSLPSEGVSEAALASPILVIGLGCAGSFLLLLVVGVAFRSLQKKHRSDSVPSKDIIVEVVKDAVASPLPRGKKYHYSISCCGIHSHLGEYPLFTMSSLHDVLACLGFVGYFDIDNCRLEPVDDIDERIDQSCAVIVFLNDEIFQDRTCLVEWEAAEHHKVPVICLGDSRNFEVQVLKQSMLKTNMYVARSYWLSYLEKFRHQAQKILIDKLCSYCLLSEPVTYRPCMALPHGKKYHYFVSHKKKHSKLGLQPESLAMAFHDVLQASGFQGFFDVDNLKEITVSEIKAEVAASCTVIVLLHDETTTSEWCRLEWEVAAACNIPVLCIADQKHFQKQLLLDQVCQVNPHLLTIPWLDYLDEWRHITQHSAIEWLEKEIKLDVLGASRKLDESERIHQITKLDQITIASKPSNTSGGASGKMQSLNSLHSVNSVLPDGYESHRHAPRKSDVAAGRLQSLHSVLPGVPDDAD